MNDGPTWPIRCGLIEQVQGNFQSMLAAGCPYNGVHIEIDDGSRANLTGMALTASLSMQAGSGVTWPESYQNWLGVDGVVSLPTPTDGIALAFACGVYYSQLVQAQAALLDQLQAAPDDEAAINAIDINAGWPG